MRTLALLAMAWLLFTLASVLLHLGGIQTFRPDLLAVFTFYVARTRPLGDALPLAILLGLLFAFFHHAAPSYFVFHGVFMVLLVRLAGRYVNLRHPFFVAVFLFAVDILLQSLMWALIHATGPAAGVRQPELFRQLLIVAATTALVAPWLHILLARIERWVGRSRQDDVYLLK